MVLRTDIIYVLPKKYYPYAKGFYKLLNPIGDYKTDSFKSYPFRYWNKFGTGVTWKSGRFLADLIPAPFTIQVLYSGSKRS